MENRDVSHKKVGNGFADVAGMEDLKTQLQSDVIDLLQHPKEAKDIGLSIPNGLLFYGPPGCGKTFFAEKFAEEAGFRIFNYKSEKLEFRSDEYRRYFIRSYCRRHNRFCL